VRLDRGRLGVEGESAGQAGVKAHTSALKRGNSADDATQAAEASLRIEPLDTDGAPDRELGLGFDTESRLPETLVLAFPGEGELVIHARPGPQEVP
jgi:hypothetical protein